MIEYTFGPTSTVLVYDEAGHILGEYAVLRQLLRSVESPACHMPVGVSTGNQVLNGAVI